MSSVCLSVTLVDCDHIGWTISEIISTLVNLGRSLSADSNIMGLLQGEHPQIWAQSDPPPVDLSVGDIPLQIAAEWLKIAQWSQWKAYRKLPSLFLMVPSLTAYDLPFPHHISAMGDPIHFMFDSGFQGRRIEWRYLRFEQIHDGGHRHVGKISSGDISSTGSSMKITVLRHNQSFFDRLITASKPRPHSIT